MSYKKEIDGFLITLEERVNDRHKMMGLLHELAHVVSYLEFFKKGVNPYEKGVLTREKEATEIEFSLLKENYPEVFKASLGDILLTYWEVLFQLELYSSPDQDLSELYAKTFNRCFEGANQKHNPTYIVNDKIVYKFLPTLPHAVAYSEIILDMISKKKS